MRHQFLQFVMAVRSSLDWAPAPLAAAVVLVMAAIAAAFLGHGAPSSAPSRRR